MSAEKKVVLVTGATSGIGKAACKLLAQHGWCVVATGRNEEALNELTSVGTAELTIQANLADTTSAEFVVESAAAAMGRIDGLVHAAGILTPGGMDNETNEGWSTLIEVNLNASWRILKAAWEPLKESRGSAVLVSSVTGLRSFPNLVGYCVSKAGVDQLVRCAALDGGPHGIRVNGINPGVVVTELHRRGGMDENNYEAFLEHGKDTHPLGRVGQADEVAHSIHFLLEGEMSGWITGATLPVDGGRQLTCLR
jgi:NAD(P)-dependent dehydrogenase (short-subunit alcohol dehydrogenase family)